MSVCHSRLLDYVPYLCSCDAGFWPVTNEVSQQTEEVDSSLVVFRLAETDSGGSYESMPLHHVCTFIFNLLLHCIC